LVHRPSWPAASCYTLGGYGIWAYRPASWGPFSFPLRGYQPPRGGSRVEPSRGPARPARRHPIRVATGLFGDRRRRSLPCSVMSGSMGGSTTAFGAGRDGR
jgi:hypothetical protein